MKDAIPHKLLQAHFAGIATPKQAAALSDWIVASPKHAAYVSSMSWLDQTLTQQVQNQAVDSLSAQERAFLDRIDPDAWQMILNSALSTKQQQKQAEPVGLHIQLAPQPEPAITAGQLLSLTGYLLIKGLQTKVGIIGSIAAVLILGTALYLQFTGPGNTVDPNQITDNTAVESNDPHKPAESALPILRDQTVATLTAQHNAQWAPAGGASAPPANLSVGTLLHPNTHLTLTAGFAEITTEEGAVVILEAPCVVELKDNDNALRLISGKLVGICETETSKGFTVHARDARIVDLGTEFGVAVTDQAVTATVFTGDIVLATPDHKPQPLTTNQTARVTDKGDGPSLVVDHKVVQSFARRMPAPADSAMVTIGDPLIPAGLGVGDTFHLFFRTADPDDNATAGVDPDWNIAQLNAYAQDSADNEPGSIVAGRFAWYAVASAVTLDGKGNITGSINAIDNTPVIAAVYLLDGTKIADNENDFYDGTLHVAHVGICSDGSTMDGEVVRTGTGIGGINMGQDSFGGNSPRIARGIPAQASNWLEASTDEQRGGARRGIYVVSQPITIAAGPGPRSGADE